jgi:FSR family fosmidomycin resistance protein-like MFS transporter
VFIVFVRSWYGASIGGYYSFYLMDDARIYIYLPAGAAGTFFGGPLAERFDGTSLSMVGPCRLPWRCLL